MLTIRAATDLLAQADSLPALQNLAQKLGFEIPLLEVTQPGRSSLGLEPPDGALATAAQLARGQGALRLLTAQLSGIGSRMALEQTRALCEALAHNAPTRLWCVITIDQSASTLCIASVIPHPGGVRVAALRVDRQHIVDSDADTIRALAGVPQDNDHLCHARWCDILRRDALSARFYRTLDVMVRNLARTAVGRATREERDELALLCASRLLFLAFLEAKGWLAGERGFLLRHCSEQLMSGGKLHERFLRPLFFGTLNTPARQRAHAAQRFGAVPFLNGGLFSPTRLEQQRRTLTFTDDAIVALIGDLLDRYRFTAREDSSSWSEAAVDPEMLGRAFECLMATDERRRSGSFYTPPVLVKRAVEDALICAIPALATDAPRMNASILDRIASLHVLDPACGSGAFLVHMLEHIANLLVQGGDTRPLHAVRREVLTRSIFGVDRNPMAVWLCELRLWLSVVIECPETSPALIPPLPNLDHNIRVGDTLAAGDLQFASPSAKRLGALRERYSRATGTRKRTLAAALDTEERNRATSEYTRMIDSSMRERRELLEVARQRDLFGERTPPSRLTKVRMLQLRAALREQRRHRQRITLGGALPFRFAAHFADVAAQGFDIVIGNPPWVRPHNLPLAERLRLRSEYRTLRNAAWRTGALRAGAGAGFAAQADLAVAFVERGTALLKPSGVLAFLLPSKLWRALAGGGVRHFISDTLDVRIVRDWSDAAALFDAAVYPSLLVATRVRPPCSNGHSTPGVIPVTAISTTASGTVLSSPPRRISVAITRGTQEHTFEINREHLSMAHDAAAPWILLPPAVRQSFERIRLAGPALGDSTLGRPSLGVKCGLNAAFLIHATEHDDDTATIIGDDHEYRIERTLLRPALRGDAIAQPHSSKRARTPESALRIVWTHAPDGKPLRTLPPRTNRWLSRFRSQLETRRDARHRQPFWTLFRTDAARSDSPRLVWADLGRTLRTTILDAGDPTVPLNSCYVMRTTSLTDAYALNTILTSPIAQAWMDAIAEPARGGWRRYLGWTVAALPIPGEWNSVREALADFSRTTNGNRALPSADDHTRITAAAYGIPVSELEPLLHWHSR